MVYRIFTYYLVGLPLAFESPSLSDFSGAPFELSSSSDFSGFPVESSSSDFSGFPVESSSSDFSGFPFESSSLSDFSGFLLPLKSSSEVVLFSSESLYLPLPFESSLPSLSKVELLSSDSNPPFFSFFSFFSFCCFWNFATSSLSSFFNIPFYRKFFHSLLFNG